MTVFHDDGQAVFHLGDCREVMRGMPEESVNCVVTSPPYWGLRDYGTDGQLGLEATPEEYVAEMVAVFREVRRVLRDDGTLWLNLGDSYASQGGPGAGGNAARMGRAYQQRNIRPNGNYDGLKPKDLVGIPWMVAFALREDGWWLRSDIIWAKPNPMPESVTDRPTKSHEYVFLLSKRERYYYDAKAIAEPSIHAGRLVLASGDDAKNGQGDNRETAAGFTKHDTTVGATRNARTVWTIPTQPYPEAHFATFPEELARRCILAGSAPGDTVLDPFGGSGTVGAVAVKWQRNAVLAELNPAYVELARRRIAEAQAQTTLDLAAG
jgi:DNA modification methylase